MAGRPVDGITRRDWMHLVGAGMGLGVVGSIRGAEDVGAVPLLQAGRGQAAATFPNGAIIRTLFADVPPASMPRGAILFHEHLSMDLSRIAPPRPAGSPPPLPATTDDVDLIVKQVEAAARDGVRCIVDGGHPDMDRDLDALKQIAKRTGMLIVASGGYYTQATYPPDIAKKSEDQIADELVREAAANRYGAFGEIGYLGNVTDLSPDEQKVLRAVGKAHVRSRLPVFTHNAYGTGPNVPKDIALRQLDILEAVGAKPDRIAIGHTCCLDDPEAEIIIRIARRGAFVGFDRVNTLERFVPDDKRVAMAVKLVNAGFADKLLLSSDFTGARNLEGPLYGRTVTVFAPKLRAAGIPDETVRQILEDNPRRFLAFVPRQA